MGITWTPSSAEVYTEVSGTITFNDDDVQWVYVDWDDGEDNSLEYAINQWEKLETDSNSITLDHTYTKAGTFYPVLRTINSAGFVSKYFYLAGTTNLPAPRESSANINSITISDGNPTSVMRVENKQVLSGIDNNIFNEGAKDLYFTIPPLLSSGNALVEPSTVSFTVDVEAIVRYSTASPVGAINPETMGGEAVVQTITGNVDLNASKPGALAAVPLSITDGKILKVLSVKLRNPKLIKSSVYTNTLINDYNKIKIFLIAKGNDDLWYPITYVSNGDPIKSVDDVKRTVTLDFSQSRAKASNKSISYYRYSDGKAFWEPTFQWQQSSSTKFNNNTKTDDSLIKENYTYYTRPGGLLGSGATIGTQPVMGIYSGNAFSYGSSESLADSNNRYIRDQFALNEFNQFYDQYHLTRLESVSNTTKYSGLDTFTNVYRIRPTLIPTGSEGYYITGPSALPPSTTTETSVLTSGAYLNGSGNYVSTLDWNVGPFEDETGTARTASEYFILTSDTKFNKIFFNATNLSTEIESNLQYNSGSSIAGVYYLRVSNDKYNDKFTQKAEWVPLKFEDTTKVEKEYRDTDSNTYVTKSNTLSKSGFIQFNTPSDWSSVPTISGLAGGYWDITGGFSPGAGSGVGTDYSRSVEGFYSGSHTESPFPMYVLSGCTGLSDYTGNDIGKYRYVYQITDSSATADEGKVWWVASSSADCSKLFLVSGGTTTIYTAPDATITGNLIRVNIYDVFDGASKVSNSGTTPGYNDNPSVSAFPFTWQVGNQATFVDELQNNFSGYALKVVISGAANHFISGNTQPGMQIWNILPFDNTSSQVVVQRDNTAYDLTYLEITSDVAVSYAGTYYQAISKNGKVFIVRTGTPIQSISFGGTALGDETQFKFNEDFTSYGALRLLKRMQAESIRMMWDEVQKDGTYVRFFGYITQVSQSHPVGGPRAPIPYTFSMLVEEVCLIDANGDLMSDVIPLGGIKDAANFK
tara:strand:- start:2009 stop:4948 length:2940 start_codon:yes stop_codon:yes gene_type:complete